LVDYYLIRNGEIDVPELYREGGAYRYTNGWNLNAVAAAAVGGAVYYALVKARGAPAPRAARAA
jgi:cytosine/uracil/thiamine/allantoin permease